MSKPVVIIAEAGINHNGDLRAALEMADVAKLYGADIVKFQTFKTDKLIRPTAPEFGQLRALEFTRPEWLRLARHCEEIGIEFLTTPGEPESLAFAVQELGVKRIKIGSDDNVFRPLIEAAHKTGLPIILSTGMATTQEITETVFDLDNFCLLHCVSQYPCLPADVNLNSIRYLQHTFSCNVGYSDHTANEAVIFAAVAAGAHMIEVHFKLERLSGLDDAVSFETRRLHKLIEGVRTLEVIMGDYGKKPTIQELAVAPTLRKGPDGLRGLM